MKFFMAREQKIVNKFVLHALHRNITYSAIVTRKTTEKIWIVGRGAVKEPLTLL